MDYEKEIAELKRCLTIVENNLNAFIKTYNMDKNYNKADNNGIRQSISNNTSGVTDNDMAICDIADLADTNSSAIDDLAVIVDELSNKILEMEG